MRHAPCATRLACRPFAFAYMFLFLSRRRVSEVASRLQVQRNILLVICVTLRAYVLHSCLSARRDMRMCVPLHARAAPNPVLTGKRALAYACPHAQG